MSSTDIDVHLFVCVLPWSAIPMRILQRHKQVYGDTSRRQNGFDSIGDVTVLEREATKGTREFNTYDSKLVTKPKLNDCSTLELQLNPLNLKAHLPSGTDWFQRFLEKLK
jgi:hypothetical protein